ncbi:hypothetical protein Ahy_A04g020443 isoform D [Arachis hypogaea]|uniref:Glucose-6-phosphate 1-epimerase n=1 Tax=Arachis hypogaea TaxID=3818 RepID=A0A445DHR1_ARAHY|nr:hypothetical protein Ahy_A04g020443 isoform D [Arachis hypogaea]
MILDTLQNALEGSRDQDLSRRQLDSDGIPKDLVWNPWDKKAKAMADFGDDEYKHMLCVEAAAVEKAVTLKPGEEWKGRLELSAVPSSYCSGQLDPQRVACCDNYGFVDGKVSQAK